VLVGRLGAQHGGVQLLDQRVVAAEAGAPRHRVAHLAAGERQALQRAGGLHVAEAMVGERRLPGAGFAVAGDAVLGAGAVERGLVDAAVWRQDLGKTQREALPRRDAALHPRPAGEVAPEVIDALAIV
jgi:hypothetical protein